MMRTITSQSGANNSIRFEVGRIACHADMVGNWRNNDEVR